MQTWPALRYLKPAMVSAAFSASAGAEGMLGLGAHLGAHHVLALGERVAEAVGEVEVTVVAGAVAAEGRPALAHPGLQDDHHAVVVGAGDRSLKAREVLVVDDPAPCGEGRVHDRL